MLSLRRWAIAAACLCTAVCQNLSNTVDEPFALWPTVDQGALAQALNISHDCLDALNITLPCDNTLLRMAGSVDNYYWEIDNITQLCSSDCYAAVYFWSEDVSNRCVYDSLVAYNKIVPAASVAGRYNDGMNIACLTNQNSTNDEDTSFCLIESQDWIGSDFIRPDCDVNSTDPSCIDPLSVSADNSRIANLYSDDVLCSECFLQLMFKRLSSDYLPDHDFSDYLINEYQDILDVCNATNNMPELVIRYPPSYDTATPPTLNFTGVDTDKSCADGQNITTSSIDPNCGCASLAQRYNVATGAVQAATDDANCKTSASCFCLPAACRLFQVPSSDNTSCDSIAASLSTANFTVTVAALLNWNPNINGLCDNLTSGDYICAGPPGGTYVPPPPLLNSSSEQSQQRGGGDGSSTGTFGNATAQCTSAQQPAPVQDGILSSCKSWCQAYTNDYCSKFAQETNITTNELFQWNPVLGDGGAECQTQFQAGYWYCVSDGNIATNASTARPSLTSTASSAPSPTQSGIDVKCNSYKIAVKGDNCFQFAQDNHVSADQLYAWNKVLGQGGADCGTEFQAGEYYCIGVSS